MNNVPQFPCQKCMYNATSLADLYDHMDIYHKIPQPTPTVSVDKINYKSILEEAQEIIYGDREKTYGDPSVNLNRIAELWNAYLCGIDFKFTKGKLLDVNDVCNFMILMKVARLINEPNHRDSKVDIAGYAALAQRCQDTVKSNEIPEPKKGL